MYEYRCINEVCGKSWTIKEGEIGCTYLNCPYCEKGRGLFVKHVREELNADIQKLALRKRDENFKPKVPINEETITVRKNNIKNTAEVKEQSVEKIEPVETIKASESNAKPNNIKVVVNTNEVEEEDDIFERIRKKRAQEEELRKTCEEDVDILEVSGNSTEEIENRIKEFEEYYYIKVLDKKIQQQGKRFNCVIKYCRR